MIYLYSGTPGSGKSMHATKDILDYMKRGRPVIANYMLNFREWKKLDRKLFMYVDNSELTPQYLTQYSIDNLKRGRENQCLVVIDECAIMLNCRDFSRKDRAAWITFFQQHRKLGYNIILVCQFDRMLDRQIRAFVEYEVIHRKLNNAGGVGLVLSLLHITCFYCVERWYGLRMVTNKSFLRVNKKLCKAYNSYIIFSE